ncbi:MAG: hypothetical protein V3V60_00140 [Sphingomonas aquatilis]|jgi:hypothetical protein|uniref:hypothetical protein n=1 Tax=Sphingomonas aquatilis TaxID=93063 RepID=UPI002F319079
MADDFNDFVDSVLVRAADAQVGTRVHPISVRDLAQEVRETFPPTWIQMLEDRLRHLNYGELLRDSDLPGKFYFKINSEGLARAHVVRKSRESKTLRGRLQAAPWGKIAGDALKVLFGAVVGHFLK